MCFDPAAGAQLRSELHGLEAADVALAALYIYIVTIHMKIHTCFLGARDVLWHVPALIKAAG